jgi:hypothetical protein
MKIDENLAAVHAYLCADGYVIRNPEMQKHKYYSIGLRNQNIVLLMDFQKRFQNLFGVKPKIGHDRARVYSKEIHNKLVKKWNFYSSSWKLPKLLSGNLKLWLRAFFDCEAWVEIEGRKNRRIGLDSINYKGILAIQNALISFGIESHIRRVKNRNIYRLQIFGKQNIENFTNEIGFLHPDKNNKLKKIINSYPDYIWNFPTELDKLKKFIRNKTKIKKPYTIRILSNKKENIISLNSLLKKKFDIESRTYENKNGKGTKYHELSIQKKEYINKALKHDLLNKQQILRMEDLK